MFRAPMNDSRALRLGVAAIVFAIALAVYARTLVPTIALVDSGELTVAAWSLGNAHAPGFPLYVMLTHLFTLLPFGFVAQRVNFASAFYGAAACAMVTFAVFELLLLNPTLTPPPPQKPKKRDAPPKRAIDDAPLDMRVIAIAALFAGLLLAFSRTLWGYATLAEVYTLNTLLIATIFAFMLAWRRRRDIRWLYAAACVYGLGLGVHHVTLGLTLVGIAALVLATAGASFIRSRALLIAAVIAVLALIAVYAYLPLAASHNPPMNWGEPDTLGRVIDHITGKQYRGYISSGKNEQQLGDAITYTMREFGPPWLPLALLLSAAGLVLAFRRDRALFLFLALVIAANLAWIIIYPIVNDRDAYLLPTHVALILAAAYGGARLAKKPQLAVALLVLPIVAAIAAWPYRDRSRYFIAKDIAQNAYRAMQPNALLLTSNWQVYSPMIYFREVERARPDVTPIETGMLIRSWYVHQLEKREPRLMGTVQRELDAYKPELVEWERTGHVPPQFNPRLDDLIVALAREQVARGGHVYATDDVALSRQPVDANVVRRMADAYDIVPRGLVLEYVPGHAVRDIGIEPLEMRGVNDASMRYDADDVVPTEVLPMYRDALLIRGRYLAAAKKTDLAIAAYKQVLALEPDNSAAQHEIALLEAGVK